MSNPEPIVPAKLRAALVKAVAAIPPTKAAAKAPAICSPADPPNSSITPETKRPARAAPIPPPNLCVAFLALSVAISSFNFVAFLPKPA